MDDPIGIEDLDAEAKKAMEKLDEYWDQSEMEAAAKKKQPGWDKKKLAAALAIAGLGAAGVAGQAKADEWDDQVANQYVEEHRGDPYKTTIPKPDKTNMGEMDKVVADYFWGRQVQAEHEKELKAQAAAYVETPEGKAKAAKVRAAAAKAKAEAAARARAAQEERLIKYRMWLRQHPNAGPNDMPDDDIDRIRDTIREEIQRDRLLNGNR